MPEPRYDLLQQLHDQIQTNQPTIYMSNFLNTIDGPTNLCATSCCLAGWGLEYKIGTTPYLDTNWHQLKLVRINTIEIDDESYSAPVKYTQMLLGLPESYDEDEVMHHGSFHWLFGPYWNNDLNFALQRIQYVIDNKSQPALFNTSKNYYTSITAQEIQTKYPIITPNPYDEDANTMLILVYIGGEMIIEKRMQHQSVVGGLIVPSNKADEIINLLQPSITTFK